jgi:hypothetical protein
MLWVSVCYFSLGRVPSHERVAVCAAHSKRSRDVSRTKEVRNERGRRRRRRRRGKRVVGEWKSGKVGSLPETGWVQRARASHSMLPFLCRALAVSGRIRPRVPQPRAAPPIARERLPLCEQRCAIEVACVAVCTRTKGRKQLWRSMSRPRSVD